MERTRVNIVVGLFMVLGIVALAYLSVQLGRVSFLGGRGYVVTVDFPSVGGLKAGSTDVTINGQTYRLGGDIIVGVDGKSVTTAATLRDAVAKKRPGDAIVLDIYRGGKKLSIKLKLGNQPTSAVG